VTCISSAVIVGQDNIRTNLFTTNKQLVCYVSGPDISGEMQDKAQDRASHHG
jgi:hypothetical protein